MDKQELRQDPIRERLLSSLSYLENNKSLMGGIAAAILVVILAAGYYSSSTKELNFNTSIKLGKEMNSIIEGNSPNMSTLSDIMEKGSSNGAASALIYMIDYNLKEGNDFAVDSLMSLDVEIEDNYLHSKLLTLKGDRALDRMEYDSALEYYKNAAQIDASTKQALELKQVSVHIEMGKLDKAMNIIDDLLEDEDIPFDVKNSCNMYKAMIENKS